VTGNPPGRSAPICRTPNCTDPNSRGWGLAIRVAGALLPLVVLFALVIHVRPRSPAPSSTLLLDVLRLLAFVWAIPYGGYRIAPWGFAIAGLLTIAFVGILFWRRDWRGGVAVLIWFWFFSWLISMFVGSGD
jgi:hypothetical protein